MFAADSKIYIVPSISHRQLVSENTSRSISFLYLYLSWMHKLYLKRICMDLLRNFRSKNCRSAKQFHYLLVCMKMCVEHLVRKEMESFSGPI